MKRGYTLITLALVLLALGCFKTDQDETEPSVRILEPFEGSSHASGQPITFRFEAIDESDLYEINVRIHENSFDHNESAPSWVFDWDTTFQHRIFGQLTDLTIEVPIPTNLSSAPYHVFAEAMDASGNRSTVKFVNFNLESSGDILAPQISVVQSEINAFPGSLFFVSGDVSDDTYVQELNLQLIDPATSEIMHESNLVLNTSAYDFLEFIPAPTESKEYQLVIRASDPFDNIETMIIIVNVL